MIPLLTNIDICLLKRQHNNQQVANINFEIPSEHLYLRPEEDDEYYHMSYDGKKTRWDNTTYPHCCSSDVDRILTIYDKSSQNQTLSTFLENAVKFPVNILVKKCTLHRRNMFKYNSIITTFFVCACLAAIYKQKPSSEYAFPVPHAHRPGPRIVEQHYQLLVVEAG